MKKLRWFFGEFFVVVSGVLVAFLLNGWWMSMKDAEKEENYLRQIHRDLQSTIAHVSKAENEQRAVLHACSQLMSAAYSKELPPDSILTKHALNSMSFWPGSQVSAAISSLVSTGALQLISNDSLRSALAELNTKFNEYAISNNHMSYDWLIPVYENFADVVAISNLRFQAIPPGQWEKIAADSLSGFPSPDQAEVPEPIDFKKLLNDREFKSTLIRLYIAQANLFSLHREFHKELLKFKAILEDELRQREVEFEMVVEDLNSIN